MELQVGMIANTQTYKENFEINEQVSLQDLADTFIPQKEYLETARLNVKSSQTAIRFDDGSQSLD